MTGATGVLGQRAVPLLVGAGHEVVGVARTDEKHAALEAVGAKGVAADIFDYESVLAAAADCAGYLNCATHIPPLRDMGKRSAWVVNDRIRNEASSIAARVAAERGMEVLVQESIVMVYPDRGEAWIDETVLIAPTDATQSVATAEENALGAAQAGLRAVVLRFGYFDAPGGIHNEAAAAYARRGFMPSGGKPGAYGSSVSADDAAAALVAALAAPTGIYNVVDDSPKTRREAAAAVATAVGRKRLIRFPGRLSLLLGDKRAGTLNRSQRVSNKKFKDATGWAPTS